MSSTFGSNAGFVDEMYAEYLEDPNSVSESWREFFADYNPSPGMPTALEVDARTAPAPMSAEPTPVQPAPEAPPLPEGAEPLRGITAKIAENMDLSLSVPTATSSREVPVKLLEENRRLLNQHQAAMAAPKISFTHLIAWAIVEALAKHPEMNVAYAEIDGKPHRVPHGSVNMGLAIDTEKRGERILVVPNVKAANAMDFATFLSAYNELVQRAKKNKLTLDDYAGTTVSLTNPGMLGTSMSVPRLMQGQGLIVGTGAIGYPAEYKGMAAEVVAELGLSKTMILTSTYDHRVIQGAGSGQFLASIEKLLNGEDDFYERIFRQLGVPYEPMKWDGDHAPPTRGGDGNLEAVRKQASVLQLVRAHRVRGHLWADLDPLAYKTQPNPELELSTYGLTVFDLDRTFIPGGMAGHHEPMKLRDILDTLRTTYCQHIGAEFMHIPEPGPRDWLQSRMEASQNNDALGEPAQMRILEYLNAAEAFETFLHRTYVGQKRFSLEGAETLIPMLAFLLDAAADDGVEDAIIGMAHRGRLNVLANILKKNVSNIFREFQGEMDPGIAHGSGDVKYHVGAEGDHESPAGKRLRVRLASNPSHLEAVDPVVEGMVRARQDATGDAARKRFLPVLIHGDAAFSGQGVVAETFGLSQLGGYTTGGTVHIVVNNQIGFTAAPEELRSSLYATDIAKAVRAPIFHVNGDYPEDVIRAVRHAFHFRHQFGADAVVDMLCYRRHGHNEGDEPAYTHPLLYAKIRNRRTVRKLYTERLLRKCDLDPAKAEQALDDFRDKLRGVHDDVKERAKGAEKVEVDREDVVGVAHEESADTSVADEVLHTVLDGLRHVPPSFEVHPKLRKQLNRRIDGYDAGRIDWGLGEALAFGSLLIEGTPVRLSGEDSGRGTFSHRHAILHDQVTGNLYVPLRHLAKEQAHFEVHDSLLSEFAVLGFEYGYSVERPEALVMWEAQFGDFANGAQVIIDQFISSAEDKWDQHAGLVMLLPHAFEGQGPEHSSARMERYLQLCAEGNWRVSYPSTPAQYFHLLRRQIKQPGDRKPLVVFTPKSLLRLPAAVSRAEDLTGASFREVIAPQISDPGAVSRVLLCAGKVYYDLEKARADQSLEHVAIIRLEQFYPFPAPQLTGALAPYRQAKHVVWVQEEPRNMGARDFLDELLIDILAGEQTYNFVCRPASASPATGSSKRHALEQADLVRRALHGE